jgi:hypothetical protein
MTQLNGHDHGETNAFDATIDEIRAVASQIKSTSVVEAVDDTGRPFEQKSHSLMLESVDKITQAWVEELVSLRSNADVIEQMVVEQATKVKSEMTRLHLLGVQAMREAQRGQEVIQQLGRELDAMMERQAA